MSDTKALAVYERMTDPVAAIKVLGNSIAKSGMFGCGSIEACYAANEQRPEDAWNLREAARRLRASGGEREVGR